MAFNAGDRVSCSTWTQVGFMSVCLYMTDSLRCTRRLVGLRVSAERETTSSVITLNRIQKSLSRITSVRGHRNHLLVLHFSTSPSFSLPRPVWKETWVLGGYMGRKRRRKARPAASLAKSSVRKHGGRSLVLWHVSSKWRTSPGFSRSTARPAKGRERTLLYSLIHSHFHYFF